MLQKIFRIAVLTVLIISSFLPSSAMAVTAFDQLIGIKIGQLTANNILASPPLPTLAGKGSKFHISPIVSYLSVKMENSERSLIASEYRGSMTGYTVGLGFTNETRNNLSFYGFATISEEKGDLQSLNSDSTDGPVTLSDMVNTSINVSTGASYRLWSKNNFPLVAGLLGGLFVSSHSSKQVLINKAYYSDPSKPETRTVRFNYSSESFVYGPMLGVQAFAEVYKITFNPYFLYYRDVSDPCQTYSTDAEKDIVTPESAKSCNVDNRELYLDGTFYAYGLRMGFRDLSINVLTRTQDDPSLSSIEVSSYTLSYTFNF